MDIGRIPQTELPLLLGAFKPIGNVVVCVDDDEAAHKLADALEADGFAHADIKLYPSAVMASELGELLPEASGAAGFGWEIQSMRDYHALALEGCGWVVVRAENRAREQKVATLAQRHGARLANKYNLLTVEELLD